jgi:hypothetical protein
MHTMDENKILEFQEKSDQFIISHELLCLLRWLMDNDPDRIKKIITRALSRGLREELQNLNHTTDTDAIEEAQLNMLEFFGMLESLLAEALQEQAVQQVIDKGLMPAIDHIDPSACDDNALNYGIEKANAKLQRSTSKEKPQDVLLKEILKQWKPAKKQMLH